jgi:hypothetical protein
MTAHPMHRHLASWPLRLAALFYLTLRCVSVLAQNEIYQRTFPVSVNEAKAAVQAASATSKGRLPTLEGFVEQNEQPIERYEKGYFECTFQVSPAAGGGTVIRATAKVTAWYSDPVAARSGYRIMISNGRLETDALDRVAESLTPNAAAAQVTSAASPAPGDFRRSAQPVLNAAGTAVNSSRLSSAVSAAHTTITPAFSLPAGANFDSIKAMRTADEKKSRELATLISNLEEIQRGQSHPGDLAAIKKSKTPIFARPAESSAVLMTADAQDEFQILAAENAWVHVQISGMSRGWIRRTQLEMPSGFLPAAGTVSENPAGGSAMFKVAKEETRSFSGSWSPLKGKPVQIEWVEPANPAVNTSRQEKLAFAKSVFLHASANLPNPTQHTEGIVVVFDSADGGQIAAAISSVKALANRTLTDSAFWRQCFLDPPESFLDSAKE